MRPNQVSDDLGGELAAVVRPDVARRAVYDEQIGENMQHIVGPELSGDLDRQALPRVFVDDREHADQSPVMGPCGNKIIRPDMVRPAGP
jgi:hypothetical protein